MLLKSSKYDVNFKIFKIKPAYIHANKIVFKCVKQRQIFHSLKMQIASQIFSKLIFYPL